MVKNVYDDDEDEVERGLDHALYDFPDMEARPAVKKKSNNKVLFLLVLSSLGFILLIVGIAKGIQSGKNNSSITEKSPSTLSNSPPKANGDLPDICDITSLGYPDLKRVCIEECKVAICCFSEEINDALKEGGEKTLELEHLIDESYKGDDNCYDEYDEVCQLYEPCLNLLEVITEEETEEEEMMEDLVNYVDTLIPLADDDLDVVCAQTDLNECSYKCEPGACCRITSDKPCNDLFPTECAGYIPCDVLDDKEERDKQVSFIHQLCTFEYVSTKEGRLQCHNACQNGLCCFDDNIDCTIEVEEQCDDYKPCAILDIVDAASYHHITDNDMPLAQEDQTLEKSINEACSDENIINPDGRVLCSELCKPGKCCFNDDECVDSPDIQDIPKSTYCMPFSKCDILFYQSEEESSDEEVSLAEEVNATCSKISTTEERNECEALCRYHVCCVDPQAEFGCFTADDEMYCKDHLGCVSLFQPVTSAASNQEDEFPAANTSKEENSINTEAFSNVQENFQDNYDNTPDEINYDAFNQVQDNYQENYDTTDANTEEDEAMQEELDQEMLDSINQENMMLEEEEEEDKEFEEIEEIEEEEDEVLQDMESFNQDILDVELP